MSVSQKINHLTHTLLYCIRSWGHPLPTCASGKTLCLCKPHPTLYIASGPDLAISGEKSRPFSPPKFCSCKVRTHVSQLKLMGNVAYVCISKNKPLNPYPVVLYKIVGSPPPHLVAIHASGNPPTKVNGKYSFWPILCKQAPNTQPCYIASVCGGLTLLFLEKNPDLFPRPKFCSCKVRTHATEISQLKLMGNVAYVCISKNKPLNPYPVVLYKIVGSPPPHLCKKICVRRFGRLGRR